MSKEKNVGIIVKDFDGNVIDTVFNNNLVSIRIKSLKVLENLNIIANKFEGNKNKILEECLLLGSNLLVNTLKLAYTGSENGGLKDAVKNAVLSNDLTALSGLVEENKLEERILHIENLSKLTLDTSNDIFVQMQLMEFLLATLFNVKVDEINKVELDADKMSSGAMAVLPQIIEGLRRAFNTERVKHISKIMSNDDK